MTSFDYILLIPTHGNWFQTNPQEHELDDCTDNTVASGCYQWERYGTSAVNLIKICHCSVVP